MTYIKLELLICLEGTDSDVRTCISTSTWTTPDAPARMTLIQWSGSSPEAERACLSCRVVVGLVWFHFDHKISFVDA